MAHHYETRVGFSTGQEGISLKRTEIFGTVQGFPGVSGFDVAVADYFAAFDECQRYAAEGLSGRLSLVADGKEVWFHFFG